jgi:lipopolysaccharide/colanic/teichoic acid biosynthesis glycosyltransferase
LAVGFSVLPLHVHRISLEGFAYVPGRSSLSRWTRSPLKRAFDLVCILCSLPLALPLLIVTAVAVRLTSRGPILFHQQRIGRGGRPFTIYKFRTMPVHDKPANRPALTTATNQAFTLIGPFLRRWKLDEFPQVYNVLRGDMSVVGPRPKLPRLHAGKLACRPGLTGSATIAFGREEFAFSVIPNEQIDHYYGSLVRPLKQRLDEDYMARATFTSDLKLILCTMLRRWDDSHIQTLLATPATDSLSA